MRNGPFTTLPEILEYLAGELIECLECGRRYKMLTGKHLRKHTLTPDEYRDKWGIPRTAALAGTNTRALRRAILAKAVASGKLTRDHLNEAMEAARNASRRKIAQAVIAAHAARIAEVRPGDHSRLPDGAMRRDGRDADRAREYQQALRAKKRGDPKPMEQYRQKWSK